MPGLRCNYNRSHIIGKNKFIIVLPVEDEIKLVFGMCLCDPFHGFVDEPADPFQPVFQ